MRCRRTYSTRWTSYALSWYNILIGTPWMPGVIMTNADRVLPRCGWSKHTCEEGGTPNEPLPAGPLPMEDGVVDDGVVSLGGLQPRGLDHEVAVLHRSRTRYCKGKKEWNSANKPFSLSLMSHERAQHPLLLCCCLIKSAAICTYTRSRRHCCWGWGIRSPLPPS